MLRLTTRLTRMFTAPKLPIGITQKSNVLGYLNASDTPTLTFFEKLSYFKPGNIYTAMDQLSRELLFTFANDYQLGIPAAVIILSFLIRGSFFIPNVRGQIAALKMKQIRPYMERFKQKSRIAQMTRNMGLMKSAKQQFRDVQKKHGIDNFYAFISIAQMPFLITWFLSLRYVAALPQVYPSVTQGFLWVPDLSSYDPYFLLPLISAVLSSYSIIISPGLKNNVTMPMFEPFIKYLKYLPFLSLPITGFFPAILNVYWATLAFNQAILMTVMNSSYMEKHIATKKAEPKSQIQQAVFVEQKPKPVPQFIAKTQTQQTLKIEPKQSKQPKIQLPKQTQTLQLLSKRPKKPKVKKAQ